MAVRTFVDAGVLIFAARNSNAEGIAARALLSEDREFVHSPFVRLEVVPKAKYSKKFAEQLAIYSDYFGTWAPVGATVEAIVDRAQLEAERDGLNALDALHVAAAVLGECDELVSGEKAGRLIYRARALPVRPLIPRK